MSWAIAPEAAMISPETVPKIVANAMDEITAKNTSPPILSASSGAARFWLLASRVPSMFAPSPRYSVRM
jgi:hypothetical protein